MIQLYEGAGNYSVEDDKSPNGAVTAKTNMSDASTQTDRNEKRSKFCQTNRTVKYNKSVQCKQGLKSTGIQTSIEVTDQISQNNALYNVLRYPVLDSPTKQHIESDDCFSSPEKEPVCDDPDYCPSSDSDSDCEFSSDDGAFIEREELPYSSTKEGKFIVFESCLLSLFSMCFSVLCPAKYW